MSSIGALALGPAIYYVLSNNKIKNVLNFIVGLSILLIVAINIIPESIEHIGWLPVTIAILFGFKIVSVLDAAIHSSHKSHAVATWVVIIGFTTHALADGMALTQGSWLPVAVILHRIPVGAGVWHVLKSKDQAFVALAMISLATIVGFTFGKSLFPTLHESYGLAIFQSVMSGALLHILLHRNNKLHKWWVKNHPHDCDV